MATGMNCDDCGTHVPSLGSLHMHRLRHHAAPPTAPPPAAPPPPPPPPPAPSDAAAPQGRGSGTGARQGIVALLGVAIVALLAGGAFAATHSGPDALTTAELTAAAQRATLTPADFPGGWTQDPPDEDDGPDDGDRALTECLGAPYDDSPEAAQSRFSSEGLSATSDFAIAPSLDWARADFATLSDGAAPGCYAKVLRAMLDGKKPAGATYDLDVTRLDTTTLVPPVVVKNTAGFRATITLRSGELTIPMRFDAIMIRHDRVKATIGFNSAGGAVFPTELMQSLTSAVVSRLVA
jgi:hypothetical protein